MILFEKIAENVSSDCYDGSIPSYDLKALQSELNGLMVLTSSL
jgi:hypothetical protein